MPEKCDACSAKLLPQRPNLYCSVCNTVKHYVCQGLSQGAAKDILGQGSDFICKQCIADALPVDAVSAEKTKSKFRAKCACCGGMSYRERMMCTCTWCGDVCHVRCVKGSLGCIICCNTMIPGYTVDCHDLMGGPLHSNNATFNPYGNYHYTNLIGEQLTSEEHDNEWNDISEVLHEGTYKLPSNIKDCKSNELNIYTNNIRSLYKNIDKLKENACDYQK